MLADDLNELGGGVGVGGVAGHVGCGVEVDGVFVSAGEVNGVTADAQARAGDEALVDSVADGRIGRAGAFGAHVALGGEAGQQIVTGGERGEDGARGHALLDGLQVLGSGMEEEMHVRVNQAGHERQVAEIKQGGTLGMRDRGTGLHNAIAADEKFAGSDEHALFDIHQVRGVQDSDRGRRR